MAKISKYVKLDRNILLEYIYDDGNLISEPYSILVDSRDRRQAYMAGDSSITGNTIGNQLFKVDPVSQKFAKVNPSYYSFLQVKDYASGIPIRHDTLKIHLPINWTFGEYLGFYIKVYAFDISNQRVFELSNFYFDMTDVSQQYLLKFTSPPLLFQEKLWGKNITIEVPALSEIANQRNGNTPKEDSINSNLTNGAGLNITSPIFIDFEFISNIQTINAITSYTLTSKVTTTVPQTPEFEKLGLVIKHSENGDFFEIFGTYNGTIGGFSLFMEESFNVGHRYYVQYDITMYEQNIRGKTTTVTQHESFGETVEYRPIIKYSTTTAIIDVEMRLIDAVDDSYIIRRASYGMLQDEVSKYALNLTKINLNSANKPKIYNIKSNIDPSLVGIANSMGRITNIPSNKAVTGKVSGTPQKPIIQIETVKVPFPVLVDKSNIVGRSENAIFNSTTFYGMGKLTIVMYPFDNIFTFTVANGDPNKPDFLNMTGYGDIKLVFKTDSKMFEFPLYTDSGSVNLSIGQLAFKVDSNKFADLKKIYESGMNVFYITKEIQSIRSVVYSGLFKVYDNIANIAGLNQASSTPTIIKDPNLNQETAVVTIKPAQITLASSPLVKPGVKSTKNTVDIATTQTATAAPITKPNLETSATTSTTTTTQTTTTQPTIEKYRVIKPTTPKKVAESVGMSREEFSKYNSYKNWSNTIWLTGHLVNIPSSIKVYVTNGKIIKDFL